jgi:hypothetical protein
MAATSHWLGRASYCALLVGLAFAAQAQAPVQFSGEIVVRDLDGGTGTGKLYIGATKQRMEFTAFGEVRPTIVDPANDTQRTISPRQRNFMELPRGDSGGPVRIPRLGPVDPNDPCGTGDNVDCRRLGAETVNGMPTQKWEYTSTDGERVTAWIATRLRFPVKTTADTGATNEIRNVVEGPQPANLFAVPMGFAQVDDIGGSGNAIADALASVNPALMQQALSQAKQMDAQNKADPTRGSRAAQWEAGAGYVVNFTITMQATKQDGSPNNSRRSNLSMRYTASVPMNYGTPAVPPSIGPRWSILAMAGSGSRQAEATPVTDSLEWEEQIARHVDTGGCTGIEYERADYAIVARGRAAGSTPLIKSPGQGYAQAMFAIDGALTSYNIMAGAGSTAQADVTTTTRRTDHCLGDRVTNTTQNTKAALNTLGQLGMDIKDERLSGSPAGLTGTRNVPIQFNGYQGPAMIQWTITPIAAR